MIRANKHFKKLQSSYLFYNIAMRVNAFQKANPTAKIIRLGIGDVTQPLPPVCIEAFHKAADEQSAPETFRGYGPSEGYAFLREVVAGIDFRSRGANIDPDEIFISDGSKCDCGNFQELFSTDSIAAIPDPVYPVYLDTNVMAGRTGVYKEGRYEGVVYLPCTAENRFIPSLPDQTVDLIYLCSPNNPTGSVMDRENLNRWVSFARESQALILFDAAYADFIREDDLPRSIFEIEGAQEVAVEFRSFSKMAGFTGTRCAYTVVPKACMAYDENGDAISVRDLWMRRQTTKFNGVSYPVQRAAEAAFSERGRDQVRGLTDYYLENAKIVRMAMAELGFETAGGVNSPYIWINTGQDDWSFFDRLLQKASVVTTPGSGFGNNGVGFIRISAFNSRENVITAMERISQIA
ncbi:MAG: LL-diaminopimelate aminotransferase [Desulfosarcina sp.]|nr:LL-diaminopimelate aminotransferase [Desulfosarcina sp.]MBC2743404.1 LL-diaminopimelate aminotransferase [Desulfosarcina sp.]MBC2766314.1 LL-diaminopimelate aminotransferase [Desulfosarcina sp.]